jgi:hypothetical protein
MTAATFRLTSSLPNAVAQGLVEHPVRMPDRARRKRTAFDCALFQQCPVPGDDIGRLQLLQQLRPDSLSTSAGVVIELIDQIWREVRGSANPIVLQAYMREASVADCDIGRCATNIRGALCLAEEA